MKVREMGSLTIYNNKQTKKVLKLTFFSFASMTFFRSGEEERGLKVREMGN